MIDHLVYGVRHLAAAVERFESVTGVAPAAGGRHPAWGTANAVLGLGAGCYLELIGPDPREPSRTGPSLFGLRDLQEDRLVGWAAKATNLEAQQAAACRAGFELGEILPGRRQHPDGIVLEWRLLLRPDGQLLEGGLVPFLIDWGTSRHPADDAPQGCSLLEVWGEHPRPETVQDLFQALGTDLRVKPAPQPRLRARLQTPRGIVIL